MAGETVVVPVIAKIAEDAVVKADIR